MKLSIIIPVYNVENYVEKCVRSCRSQDIPEDDYEIIIVNDGTKDNSMSVVTLAIQGANNVSIYHQDNMGLSLARNTGLLHAKGEYVWFVDSDDWIEPNSLSSLFYYLDGDLDILQIQYQLAYDDGRPSTAAKKTIIDGIQTGKDVLIKQGVDIPAQFSIYRRLFLLENNLSFYPHIYHEDVEFKPRAFIAAAKVTSYNKTVYNYLQRAGSITSHKGMKHATDLLLISERTYDLFGIVDDDVIPYLSKVIACCINWVLIIIDNLSENEKSLIFKSLKEKRKLIHAMRRSDEKQYRWEALALLMNIKIGRRLYLYLRKK